MALPPQPQDPQDWPTGLSEMIEPLVRRVLAPNASPFTFTGTQTYLVGNEQGLAVIDPGPDDPAHLNALIAAIGEAKVIAIACTHTHRDHSPAAAPLAVLTGAPVIGCAPLVIESDQPRIDAPFDKSYSPDKVLTDGESIIGPGWKLTAVTTPGHTSNHVCFALLEEGAPEEGAALFTGDHVMAWSTSVVVPPDGEMADYMASLDKLYQRADRVYYPAHGPAVEKPRQLVRGMIGHRRQRERQILRLLGEESRSITGLVPVMYAGVAEYLWPAAGQSVLAHLLDLEARGIVVQAGDIWACA